MLLYFQSVWWVLLDLAPWLLLGALVAGVLHVCLPVNFLRRQFTGPGGVAKAVLLGIPLPLCSCAVIPVGLSLKQSGASKGATVAFLISTPQTGVDSVLVCASFLGWPFALFKVLCAGLTGLIGGWWTDREQHAALPIVIADQTSGQHVNNWLQALLCHSLELLRSIWRWLLFGVLVSAAIKTYIPAGALSGLGGGNDLMAMLVVLVIALPLYVCATASVPIAAALVSSGLPVGAALVFLMAGPATNVATMGAIFRTLGRRALVIYLATVIIGSVACGWLFGFVINTVASGAGHVHEVSNWWNETSVVILLLLMLWFALQELRLLFRAREDAKQTVASTKNDCCHPS